MADRISSAGSPVCSFDAAEAPASATSTAPTATAAPQPSGGSSHTEPWAGDACRPPAHEPGTCDGTTAAAIQQQYAQAVADRAALGRSLDFMGEQLDRLATAPEAQLRGAALAVASRADQPRSRFFEAASRLPEDVVRQAVEQRLRAAHPNQGPKALAEKTELAMARLGDCVKTQAAARMRHAAHERLGAAAKEFRATAGKPGDLQALAATVNALERPGATAAQRAQAEVLRGTLGLESDGRQVTPDALAQALSGRAAVMEKEAHHLAGAGSNTLFRTLLTHDVRGLVADGAGVRPGSWAAEGLDAVHQRGESDEAQLAMAKLVAGVALAGATAGLGLGVIAGMGATAAINAPEVLVAHHEVAGAAAGASAGTAAVDAQEVAQRRAWLKTYEAAASTAFAGVLGAAGGHGAVQSVADHTAAHIAEHAAFHGAVDGALMHQAHTLEFQRGAATGEDAIARARRAAGN